ncbi:hypothetical protein U1Q18_022423 [Sarracenia purpurea var. burkii]
MYASLKRSRSSIDLPAILLYLSVRSGEGTDIPHLEHGVDEVEVEGALAAAAFIDDGVGGSAIEELLIGVKESPPILKILVVVVENGQSLEI